MKSALAASSLKFCLSVAVNAGAPIANEDLTGVDSVTATFTVQSKETLSETLVGDTQSVWSYALDTSNIWGL